jgi:hypothetical protein
MWKKKPSVWKKKKKKINNLRGKPLMTRNLLVD